MPAEARRMHARIHADPEKAELGVAEGGACAAHEWDRSDHVHPRSRTQPAGALDCADPRRPREGSAWRAVSRDSRHAGCGRRRRPHAGTLKVRSKETEERLRSFEFQVSSFEYL